jgi:hypothetical protein
VRAALVVAIAAALVLGACGGDGDSNRSAISSGTSQESKGKGPSRGSGPTSREREKKSKKRQRAQGGSEVSGSVFFYKARSRCSTIPIEALVQIYQAKSDNPKDVASAYADREAPASIYRRASVAGCLAGNKSRPRP